MDRFSKFHPLVGFSFFMFAIILSLVFVNPIFLFVSFVAGFLYYAKLKGKEVILSLFKFYIPLVLFVGVFNMIFCHYGSSILFSIKNIDFTLECLCYGLTTGLMIASVMVWFSSYNEVITSEKFMSLFGAIAPNLSMLFCMVLRFIPLMRETSKQIKEAQIGIGNEIKGVKNSLNRFSSLISISLEKSIETADSMKARGFGKKNKTYYSRYEFKFKDGVFLLFISILFVGLIAFKVCGFSNFEFNPAIKSINFSVLSLIIYTVLTFIPLIVDLMEDVKWLYLKSKI